MTVEKLYRHFGWKIRQSYGEQLTRANGRRPISKVNRTIRWRNLAWQNNGSRRNSASWLISTSWMMSLRIR